MKWYSGLLMFIFIIGSTGYTNPEAEKLLQSRLSTPLLQADGTMTGEGVCWHAAYQMDRFVEKYRSSNDPAFLEVAVQYYDALIAKLHTSPDGYRGWVGPFIYDEKYICDVHVGDAILINPMLDFAETVLKSDDTQINEKFSAKAFEYVNLAKKHLLEKWDQRGTWQEYGPYGYYVAWDQYMTPENLKEWQKLPVDRSTLTLPINKNTEMAIAALRIYRITGEEPYREKAERIFNYMKSRFCLYQNHYIWNYWEPCGEWDIDTKDPNKLRHWVNVHPYRNYQAGEVADVVEAYHSGVTFSEEDIQRIINTNLKVMWNGDRQNPEWQNSNYTVTKDALGKIPEVQSPPGEPKHAGILWSSLRDFDATIRELAHLRMDEPPSFKRKYSDLPVTELQIPFHSNQYLNMVTAFPSSENNRQMILISQSRLAGELDIDLYTKDGSRKVQDITQEQVNPWPFIYRWDINDLPAGEYRIRWTMKGEFRDYPIWVQ